MEAHKWNDLTAHDAFIEESMVKFQAMIYVWTLLFVEKIFVIYRDESLFLSTFCISYSRHITTNFSYRFIVM